MAKSGSYDFNLSVQKIVNAAHRKLGVLAENQTLSAEKMQNGIEAINARIKMFPSLMKKLWGISKEVIAIQSPTVYVDHSDSSINWETIRNHTTTADTRPSSGSKYLAYYKKTTTTGVSYVEGQAAVSKSQYNVDSSVVAIDNVRLVKADNETNLTRLSREEYFSRSLKNSNGEPSGYYFEKRNSESNSYLYLFPSPSAQNYVIEYDSIKYPQDFDGQSDTPDFPVEWIPVLIYGTAIDLYAEYPAVSNKNYTVCKELYLDSLNAALALDEETGDFNIVPNMEG